MATWMFAKPATDSRIRTELAYDHMIGHDTDAHGHAHAGLQAVAMRPSSNAVFFFFFCCSKVHTIRC